MSDYQPLETIESQIDTILSSGVTEENRTEVLESIMAIFNSAKPYKVLAESGLLDSIQEEFGDSPVLVLRTNELGEPSLEFTQATVLKVSKYEEQILKEENLLAIKEHLETVTGQDIDISSIPEYLGGLTILNEE